MEIKFRAKDIDTGKWQYGYYVFHEKITPCVIDDYNKEENEEHLLIFDGFSDWNLPKPWYKCDIDKSTICQYTNLKDKNGNEVYTGDIVVDEHNRDWLVFDAPGGFCVCRVEEWLQTKHNPIIYSGLSEPQNAAWTRQSCEVVGNIYDNHDYLKENTTNEG